MTETEKRNHSICAAMLTITEGLPETKGPAGPLCRLYRTHDLRVLSWVLGDETVLDAYFADHGKVANFRVSADRSQFFVGSIKPKTLPFWLPLLRAALLEKRVGRVFH